MQKTPVTIVTGFLGAGKTSLVRHLLGRAGGRRLAVIVNEFGELGVDREALLGCGIEACGPGDIVELANGCLCCTVADDFLPTMEALLGRAEPPAQIIVETSGLALPKPLLKAMGWPGVRERATVDGVLTVVDAEAVGAGRFAADPAAVAAQRLADPALDHDDPLAEVFAEQAGSADLVILNKADLVPAGDRPRVEARVRAALRPGVGLVWTSQGALDPAVALGLGMTAEADLAARPSPHEDLGIAHDHDDFDSLVVPMPPQADALAARLAVATVIRRHGILRAKGFLAVRGRPLRLVVQAVGDRVEASFDAAPAPAGGRLVVIGLKGLDGLAIAAELAAA